MTIPTKLQKRFGKRLKFNEPMAKHTSFGIGGPADVFLQVENIAELKTALSLTPHFIIGNGTNLLVSDKGIRGGVIKLAGEFAKFSFDGTKVTSGAGVSLGQLISHTFHRGLSGLEFAVGIPGTVGGALFTNAGVKEQSIGDLVEQVELLSDKLEIITREKNELTFTYRKSDLPPGWIILKAVFKLQRKPTAEIAKKVFELYINRRKTQPTGSRSAGSIFLNPAGKSAGELIDQAGLKGTRIGGAGVSAIHANFIENVENATADDVLNLLEKIKSRVKERFGSELRPEIQFVGEK